MRINKPKAAAIYLNEALKYGSPEASAEARELLAELAAADPDAVSDAQKGQPDQDYTIAGENLKNQTITSGRLLQNLPDLAPEASHACWR